MTREEFIKVVSDLVNDYMYSVGTLNDDPQLRVNPALLRVDVTTSADMQGELADSDEAIENAAMAERPETEDASDYQASQNPDFYPIRTLVKITKPGSYTLDEKAIAALADNYTAAFTQPGQ